MTRTGVRELDIIELPDIKRIAMLPSAHQGISKCILNRLIQIHHEIIVNDPEFRELGEEPDELRNQIAAKLIDTHYRELLERYDCLRTEQMQRQDEIIYTEGLMDGMIWGYWVALVSKGLERIEV